MATPKRSSRSSSNESSYATEMNRISDRFRKFGEQATYIMRENIVNELLKESPVDTGFLRNHVKLSHTLSVPDVPVAAKTEEAVANLKFQGLNYREPPSRNEIDESLGVFKDNFPYMKDVYAVIPVEYAQILVDSQKYSEFQRKAAESAQRKTDAEVKEAFKSA